MVVAAFQVKATPESRSDNSAGLLHVRSRTFDALLLLGVSAAILLLGLIVPN